MGITLSRSNRKKMGSNLTVDHDVMGKILEERKRVVTMSNLPPPREDAFMKDIHRFTEEIRTGTCEAVNVIHAAVLGPEEKARADKELARQALTFEQDVKATMDGEMNYSDLRSLYG